MLYKHVIWDFDGTLFDTYLPMAEAFRKELEIIGVIEPVEEIMSHMKITMGHAYEFYEGKYSIDDSFIEKFKARRGREQAEKVKPFDGAIAVCNAIHKNGGKNHLYTHRGSSALDFLGKYDLLPLFSEIITDDSGFPRKPCAKALLHLIEKQNADPATTIMVGDREMDIQAARNAGIASCFFTNNGGPRCDFASVNIHDLSELFSHLGITR